jgi:hypothetical protein
MMLSASQLLINSILLAIQHRKEKVQEPTTHCQHCLFFVSYQANYACASSQQRRKLKRSLLAAGVGTLAGQEYMPPGSGPLRTRLVCRSCRMRLVRALMRLYSETVSVDERCVGAAACGGAPTRRQWTGRPVSP